jgi:glycosyltransferase involved in cell wall biosynthesis
MDGRICLNWLPFDESVTGASLRAFELHRRLPGDLDIVAFTTARYPAGMREELPAVGFRDLASSRSGPVRLGELTSSWWGRKAADTGCRLWVTDTVPVANLDGIATCMTVHDLRHRESASYVRPLRFIRLSLLMSASLRRADSVIAVSEWGASELQRLYGTDCGKISVIPNAVDPSMVDCTRNAVNPAGSPFILSVGHLEPRKNQSLLIRAFAGVAVTWPGTLVIAGRDLGEGKKLRRLITELNLDGRVQLAGAVDRRSLLALYRWCELVVCPSVFEGFGITLLEGMVMGKPVVATDIPPHREVGGDAALWVSDIVTGSGEMTDAIQRVLGERDLSSRLADAGKIRARLFSWDSSAVSLERVYRGLIT